MFPTQTISQQIIQNSNKERSHFQRKSAPPPLNGYIYIQAKHIGLDLKVIHPSPNSPRKYWGSSKKAQIFSPPQSNRFYLSWWHSSLKSFIFSTLETLNLTPLPFKGHQNIQNSSRRQPRPETALGSPGNIILFSEAEGLRCQGVHQEISWKKLEIGTTLIVETYPYLWVS